MFKKCQGMLKQQILGMNFSVKRLNYNFYYFSNATKFYFCEKNKLTLEDEQKNVNFKQNNILEENKTKAAEILKVVNAHFEEHSSINDSIKFLLVAANYKKFPEELIPKIEKFLLNNLKSLDEGQLTKVIYAFTILNYNSNKLYLFIERSLINKINSFSPHNMVHVFKSYAKNKNVTPTLEKYFRTYISKNMSKFKIGEMCDVFLNYPRLIQKADKEIQEIMKTIYDQISIHIEKLDITRLVNIYFLLYSNNSNSNNFLELINVQYTENFINYFHNLENLITPKLIYTIIITHHFAKENLINFKNENTKNLFKDLILKKIYDNISLFTPIEINSVITILNMSKKNFFELNDTFYHKELEKINLKFFDITERDVKDMTIDEMLLYTQTILTLKNFDINLKKNLNEILITLQNEILNKVPNLTLFSAVSLLDLIHHFGNKDLPKLNLETITEKILENLKSYTSQDLTKIFNDYYLITLLLADLKYLNKNFWQEYVKYFNLFSYGVEKIDDEVEKENCKLKLEKIKYLIGKLNIQTPVLL